MHKLHFFRGNTRILDGIETPMNCHELAARIERIEPKVVPRDVARLCLLLANEADDLEKLGDDEFLSAAWRDMCMRVQAASDQHAAMAEELDSLGHGDPSQFTSDQVWVLVRAIKVQSQILQMYVGQPQPDY